MSTIPHRDRSATDVATRRVILRGSRTWLRARLTAYSDAGVLVTYEQPRRDESPEHLGKWLVDAIILRENGDSGSDVATAPTTRATTYTPVRIQTTSMTGNDPNVASRTVRIVTRVRRIVRPVSSAYARVRAADKVSVLRAAKASAVAVGIAAVVAIGYGVVLVGIGLYRWLTEHGPVLLGMGMIGVLVLILLAACKCPLCGRR